MKKIIFIVCCLFATTLIYARPVQITIEPAAAQSSAQVFEKGSRVAGANGIFTVELGFLQEKYLTIKADGFDSQQLFISYKHKKDSYPVTLNPNRKKVVVSTTVNDATIYIDGEELGKGTASFNIFKDSRKNIKIVADGYDSYFGNVSFNDAPGLVINKECPLVPNLKDVYVSVEQVGATVFANGKPVGVTAKEMPVKVTISKETPTKIRVECKGYMDVFSTINFYDNEVNYNLGKMPEDEFYKATAHNSADIANDRVSIKVNENMSREDALNAMIYRISQDFRNLEVNNYNAGWIRTKWNYEKYPNIQIRTRIEIQQVPFDGDGLKFDVLIESEKADPNAGTDDQIFEPWDLLLKKYAKLSEDLRAAVQLNVQAK